MPNTVPETTLIDPNVLSNLYSLPDDGRGASPETYPKSISKDCHNMRGLSCQNTVSETALIDSNVSSNLYSLPDDRRQASSKT